LEFDESATLMGKIDACLDTMGTTVVGQDESAAAPNQSPGPSGMGFGASYEGYMYGDYSGWGGYGYSRPWGSYGGYGGYGGGLGGYYGRGYGGYGGYGSYGGYGYGRPWGYYGGGWGGYGRGSSWDISYGGYGGYNYGGYGGSGSWGAQRGYGGLRRGSFAERALARSSGAAAAQPGQQVQVTVPQGVGPGDKFTVATSSGGRFEVTVPQGVQSGAQIMVQLPTQAYAAAR